MRSGIATLTPDRFRKRKGPSAAGECLLICLCCFGLLVIEAKFPAIQKVRGFGELVKVPINAVVRVTSGGFRGAEGFLRTQTDLTNEIEELRTRLLHQNVELQQMELLKAEIEDYRSLLALDTLLGSNSLAAETLPGNPDPSRHRVTLSIGSREGAFIGQAVVNSRGVVGQVSRDYLLTSEALLISDASHSMPVMIERTGLQAIADGTGRRDHWLLLSYMPAHADIVKGDVVVSSGAAGRFPEGLRVGVVEQVHNSSGQAFIEAFVSPSSNLERVRRVLLLHSQSDTMNGEAPEVAAAGS